MAATLLTDLTRLGDVTSMKKLIAAMVLAVFTMTVSFAGTDDKKKEDKKEQKKKKEKKTTEKK